MSKHRGKKSEIKESSAPLLANKIDPLAEFRVRYPKLLAKIDAQVATMQTPKAKAAIRAMDNITPEELGQAAVRAARSNPT